VDQNEVIAQMVANNQAFFLSVMIIVVISMILLLIVTFYYQRRQAVAMERMADVTDSEYWGALREKRKGRSEQALKMGGAAWLAEQIRLQTGQSIPLNGDTLTLDSLPVVASTNEFGDVVLVSPLRKRDLQKRLRDLIKNQGDLFQEFASEKPVLDLLRKTRDEFQRSISDDEWFDLHAEKAGRDLKVGWGQPDNLNFMVKLEKRKTVN
jgi:hypothetical protein